MAAGRHLQALLRRLRAGGAAGAAAGAAALRGPEPAAGARARLGRDRALGSRRASANFPGRRRGGTGAHTSPGQPARPRHCPDRQAERRPGSGRAPLRNLRAAPHLRPGAAPREPPAGAALPPPPPRRRCCSTNARQRCSRDVLIGTWLAGRGVPVRSPAQSRLLENLKLPFSLKLPYLNVIITVIMYIQITC